MNADADIGSLKSLYTLFDKYLATCWWNLNKIVWSEQYKILSFWQKMVNHFWQCVDAILKDFLWLKQLFDAKLLI